MEYLLSASYLLIYLFIYLFIFLITIILSCRCYIMSERQPSTPPSLNESTFKEPIITPYHLKSNPQEKNCSDKSTLFFTPKTPSHGRNINNGQHNNNNQLPSPQTLRKATLTLGEQEDDKHLIKFQTPKFKSSIITPEQTPRHKRKEFNDAIHTEHSKLHSVLFPIAQSTIGSGRRILSDFKNEISDKSTTSKKLLLNFRSSLKIQLEEDEEDEEERHGSGSKMDSDRETELMNFTSSSEPEIDSENDYDFEDKNKLKKIRKKLEFNKELNIPSTPTKQILSDEYISNKLGIERCRFFKDLDVKDVENDVNKRISLSDLKNPFIEDEFDQKATRRNSGKSDPRLENEIEMVHHITGEKFYINLTDEGKKIKPKRLFFDQEGGGDEMNSSRTPESSTNKVNLSINDKIDNPATPETPNNKVNLLISDEISLSDIEDEDDEIIRKEKIKNPFRDLKNERLIKKNRAKNAEFTRIEYINQTTGERIIESMDDEQLSIKPKKLKFN